MTLNNGHPFADLRDLKLVFKLSEGMCAKTHRGPASQKGSQLRSQPSPSSWCSLVNTNRGLWRQGDCFGALYKKQTTHLSLIDSRMMGGYLSRYDKPFTWWYIVLCLVEDAPRAQRQWHTKLRRSYCGRRALSKHLHYSRSNLTNIPIKVKKAKSSVRVIRKGEGLICPKNYSTYLNIATWNVWTMHLMILAIS